MTINSLGVDTHMLTSQTKETRHAQAKDWHLVQKLTQLQLHVHLV